MKVGGKRNRVYGSFFRVARGPDLFRRSSYVSVLFRRRDLFCYVLAAIGSWAFLGEGISLQRWLGISLVALGAAFVARPLARMKELFSIVPDPVFRNLLCDGPDLL
jgi:hypothetical protein